MSLTPCEFAHFVGRHYSVTKSAADGFFHVTRKGEEIGVFPTEVEAYGFAEDEMAFDAERLEAKCR